MSAPAATSPDRRRVVLVAAGALLLVVLVVVAARLVRFSDAGEAFVARYPGAAPRLGSTPVGFPLWLAVQHALNATFLLFTVRSGWRLHRAGRPTVFWTRRNAGLLRTRGMPVRIGIDLWSHYVADTLWAVNGVVFVVLLFTTGQWQRIVPLSPAIVPAALSTALQYASLAWPTTDGWIDYNALQSLSYGVVTLIAAPLMLITGLRLAPGFAARLRPLDRVLPLRMTKAVHFWTMVFLVAFTAVHVFLVLATGAIRNLNHLYALRDDQSWAGAAVFAATVVLTAALVLAARPRIVRRAASATGDVLERPARPPRR